MTEVACRAFAFFATAERAGVARVDQLIEGLPITRAELERPGNRVSWDTWARLTDRFAEVCGSDQALIDSCRFAMTEGFAGSLARIAGMFAEPRTLYRVSMLWVAQGLYRSVRFSVTEPDPGHLRIEAALLPGFRESRAWFLLFAHGALLAPTFAGLPPAQPESLTFDSRSATIVLRAARSAQPSFWARVSSRLRSAPVVAHELVTQQNDLTRAFDDMRRATASFQNVLDGLPLAIAVLRDGLIRYANPSLGRLAGRDAASMRGQSLQAFVRSEDLAALAALERGEQGVYRLRLVSPAPDEPVLDAQAVSGAIFEDQPATIVIGLDVSHAVRSRAHLERSEATIRLLISTQPELVIRLDRSLRVLDLQPGREFGATAALTAVVGRDAREVLATLPAALAFELAELVGAYQTEMAAGRVFERSLLVPTSDGQLRELHLRGTPVLAGTESILVVRDETRRREVERRLALAEHMASLGVLSAGIAHEINNPLTYVALSADALEGELAALPDDLRARLADLIGDLRDGTERIRATVSRMKGLSRPTIDGKKRLLPRRAVEAALAIAAHETTQRARVVADLQDTREVLADPTELGQVFVNLLVNAAQALDRQVATEPGGHQIQVRLFDDGDAVVFECEDSGEGIPPEHLGRIFDPFFTTKERRQGTGLGLSIVHRIVREHGGTIAIRSVRGQGSTFTVRLPAAPVAEDAPVVIADAPVTTCARPARVIVIDDDPMVGRSIARILAAHEVTVFVRAEPALAALRGDRGPDLILCDLEMPGMSGIDLYDQVTAFAPALAARFTFFTGGAFTARALAFVERPEIRVVAKPVSADRLHRLVSEAVVGTTAP